MGPETRWNTEVATALMESADELPDTRVGKMFGYPALYAGGKLFACAYGDGVGLKLPGEVVAALIKKEGFEPFQPYGKARMRKWVFVKAVDRDAVHARSYLLEQAARFVAEGQPSRTGKVAARLRPLTRPFANRVCARPRRTTAGTRVSRSEAVLSPPTPSFAPGQQPAWPATGATGHPRCRGWRRSGRPAGRRS